MFLDYGVAAGASGSSGMGSSFASIMAGNQATFLVVAGIVLALALFLLRAR
ncbi:MAG: hypothetical protein KDK28_21570 [Maritimibacter sp.]|nr:hypothetical protein [Maritimibacter sp.]